MTEAHTAGRRTSRLITRVLTLSALAVIALAAWGMSSPAGSSPDDDFHLASIWCGQGERPGLCESITQTSVMVPDNVVHAPCFAFNKEITGACQAKLIGELTVAKHMNSVEHTYPPGFYWVMSWFAGHDVSLSVQLMRLFNTVLFVGCAAATFVLIKPAWRLPLGLSLAVTIVPLGAFIIPSTNPSSWILYAPAFIYVLARTLVRERSRGRAITIAAVTIAIAALASSARADAAIFAVAAFALAMLAEWGKWWRNWMPYVTGAVIAVVGIVSLLVARQSSAAAGLETGASDAARRSIGLLLRNLMDLPGLYVGSIGASGLGWLDTPMYSVVWVSLLLVLGGLLMSAISTKRGPREFLIPALATLMMIVVPIAIAQNSGATFGSYVQPRYVLPLLALMILTLLTTRTMRILGSRRQLMLTLLVVAVVNAISLATNTLRYTGGGAHPESWQPPLPGIVVIAVGSIAAAALAIVSYRSNSQLALLLADQIPSPDAPEQLAVNPS